MKKEETNKTEKTNEAEVADEVKKALKAKVDHVTSWYSLTRALIPLPLECLLLAYASRKCAHSAAARVFTPRICEQKMRSNYWCPHGLLLDMRAENAVKLLVPAWFTPRMCEQKMRSNYWCPHGLRHCSAEQISCLLRVFVIGNLHCSAVF